MMKLAFLALLFLAILKSSLATGTISFNTTLVEVEERDYNKVILKVERNGVTSGTIHFSCMVCNDFICNTVAMCPTLFFLLFLMIFMLILQILNSTQDFTNDIYTSTFGPSGETSSQCIFFVKDDIEPEGDEIYAVQLGLISGNNVKIGLNLTYIKILANDDGNGVVGFNVVSGGHQDLQSAEV